MFMNPLMHTKPTSTINPLAAAFRGEREWHFPLCRNTCSPGPHSSVLAKQLKRRKLNCVLLSSMNEAGYCSEKDADGSDTAYDRDPESEDLEAVSSTDSCSENKSEEAIDLISDPQMASLCSEVSISFGHMCTWSLSDP